MLDFDGTLSPIAPTPDQAILPEPTRGLLQKCSDRFQVAIVSGRSLENLKSKVGLGGLTYAGNHGLEWQIGSRAGHAPFPPSALKAINDAKSKLGRLAPFYQGFLLEDKRLTLAVHYRLVRPTLLKSLKADLAPILDSLAQKGVSVIDGKKTYDLRPSAGWTKGHFADFLHHHLEQTSKRILLPIYVGDDVTDEDVFRTLKGAITIRVGRKRTSLAHYFLANQTKIDEFLEWLLRIA
jgi:trehalose-phosphatase